MAKPACKEGGGKMLTCGTSSPLFHSFKASIFSFAKPRTLSAYGYCFCACWPYAVHLAYPVIPWSSSFILLVWIARRVQNFFWFTSFLGDSLFGKHKCSSLNCIHHSHFICKDFTSSYRLFQLQSPGQPFFLVSKHQNLMQAVLSHTEEVLCSVMIKLAATSMG